MTQIAHYARPLWSRCFSSESVAADVKRGGPPRFYVKRVETTPQGPFANMSDEELVNFIRTEAADILPQLEERSKLKSVH
jgi:hypothetical protein